MDLKQQVKIAIKDLNDALRELELVKEKIDKSLKVLSYVDTANHAKP